MSKLKKLQDSRSHYENVADELFTKICNSILDNASRDNYDPVMDSIIAYGAACKMAGEAHAVIGEHIGVDYTHSIPTGANENDSEN